MAAAKPEIVKFSKNQDTRRCISTYRQDINEISTALSRSWVQIFNGRDKNTVQLNRKWKIQDGGLKTSIVCISAFRQGNQQNITEIPTAEPMFLRSSIPLGLMGILCDRAGSGKIQDGASKLQMHVSLLPDKISTEFKRLCLCFRGLAFHWNSSEDYATKPQV